MVFKDSSSVNSSAEPNKSFCPVEETAGAAETSVPNKRLAMVLNSNSANTSFNFSSFGSFLTKDSTSILIGTCVSIVANFLLSKPCSANSSNFSFILPFNSWVWAITPSMVSYCLMSFLAVFSPTPGIPGMLSTESPHKPRISIT